MFSDDEEKIRDAYNICDTWPEYDAWHQYTHAFIDTHVNSFLKKYASPDSIILNAGSGDTHYNCLGTVFDCDIAENKLIYSNHAIHASITSLPCKEQSFDICICVGSVLNYTDAALAISEIARVLKSGGKAIIEFERSLSAEFLFTSDYGKDCFRNKYLYGNKEHSLWLYSECYIDTLLQAHNLHIIKKTRFHTTSSLVSRLLHDDNKAAPWAKVDEFIKPLSYLFAHNSIYIIDHTMD